MIKSLRAFIYLCVVCCFFISCSDVPQQYEGKLDTSNPNRVVDFIPKIPTDATNESGSRLLYQKRKLTEQEKKDKIRNNSLMPIDYKSASIGNISMKTEHDEALSILNKDMQMGQRVFYEENLMVIWREDSPRVPHMIAALNGYQGKMDFGSKVGHRAIGESFQDQFSKGIKDIQKDEKAISFITELYKYLEESEENCLETHKCQLAINPQGTYIMFVMPKMVLLFGNNERRQLVQIAISRNEKPGCFSQPFDMLNTQFFCGVSEDGVFITIKLGEGYKEVIQKSGIDPMLPINYGNSVLIQETFSTVISWKRINLEKEEESISENSHLSGVYMRTQYSMPFLIDQSLVKITLEESNSVQMSLEPIVNETSEDSLWTMGDIQQKLTNIKDKNIFYLSANMPQIKEKYTLQRNFMKSFLDLLEESYSQFYSEQEVEFKIYKKIYGEHDDKYSPGIAGDLVVTFEDIKKKTLVIEVFIKGASGHMSTGFSFLESDLLDYSIKNQNPIHLNEDVFTLSGVSLDDKIYLRNKNLGDNTAIASYLTDGNRILISMVDYSDEKEASVVYESGMDRNITYRKSEYIKYGGAKLFILPTSIKKEIGDKLFDEYVIEGIAVDGALFFGSIHDLCFIDTLDFQMGDSDQIFSDRLIDAINQVSLNANEGGLAGKTDRFECPYISPQDEGFSGLKTKYFFPGHRLVLGFYQRALSEIRIYKDLNTPVRSAQGTKTNEPTK